jgi:hypothetical protein
MELYLNQIHELLDGNYSKKVPSQELEIEH